jgi:hypothetical protein
MANLVLSIQVKGALALFLVVAALIATYYDSSQQQQVCLVVTVVCVCCVVKCCASILGYLAVDAELFSTLPVASLLPSHVL